MDQRLISAMETAKRRARIGAERTRDAAQFAYAVAKVWGGKARTWLARATRVTTTVLKHVGLQTLIGLERILLSHTGRERIQATAVFALIIAFAVTSVDYLVTGGPEFNMNARATPYTTQVSLIAPRSRDAGIELALLETPAPQATVAEEEQPVRAAAERRVERVVEDAKAEPAAADAPERDKPKAERT